VGRVLVRLPTQLQSSPNLIFTSSGEGKVKRKSNLVVLQRERLSLTFSLSESNQQQHLLPVIKMNRRRTNLNLNPKLQTPNPKPQTPNPKPQTPNPKTSYLSCFNLANQTTSIFISRPISRHTKAFNVAMAVYALCRLSGSDLFDVYRHQPTKIF
jgi:hypothetical protein